MCAQNTTFNLSNSKFQNKSVQKRIKKELRLAGVTLKSDNLLGGRSKLEVTSGSARGIQKAENVINKLMGEGRLGSGASVRRMKTRIVSNAPHQSLTGGKNIWQTKHEEQAIKVDTQVSDKPTQISVDRMIGNIQERPAVGSSPITKPSAPNLRETFNTSAGINPDFLRINESRMRANQAQNQFAADHKVPVLADQGAIVEREVSNEVSAPIISPGVSQPQTNSVIEQGQQAQAVSLDTNYQVGQAATAEAVSADSTMVQSTVVAPMEPNSDQVPLSQSQAEATELRVDSSTTVV